jgi:serine phosphatase RsbU (regulator of sigma subunit)
MTSQTPKRQARADGRRREDAAASVLREAASEISQGLLVVDSAMRIVFVNAPYLDFFRLASDAPEIQEARTLESLLRLMAERGEYGPGPADVLVESRIAPVRERRPYRTDRKLPDGRHVEVTGNPLADGGYVFTFTDISDRVAEHARLDALVRARTEELNAVNEKLIDGIEYARLIQSGILPQPEFFRDNLGPHFVLFRPADIVGGDFYLGVRTPHGLYVGLGDCTGHGVPGAMMTMMAASICRRAINECGDQGPAAVMAAIDRLVRSNLHQSEAQVGPDNGLELALCLVEPEARTVRAAAAGLDIFVQAGGAIERLKGTKHGLGYGRRAARAETIGETRLAAAEAERLFLTSDGILDQSGGEKGFGFGRRRFLEALNARAAEGIGAQGEAVTDAIDAYAAGFPQRDDMAVLGFQPFPV